MIAEVWAGPEAGVGQRVTEVGVAKSRLPVKFRRRHMNGVHSGDGGLPAPIGLLRTTQQPPTRPTRLANVCNPWVAATCVRSCLARRRLATAILAGCTITLHSFMPAPPAAAPERCPAQPQS